MISQPLVSIQWYGLRRMTWNWFLLSLCQALREGSYCEVLILHLGENDLVEMKRMALTWRILRDLKTTRELCQGTVLVWSYFLQRRIWRGDQKKPSWIKWMRTKANNTVCRAIMECSYPTIPYNLICCTCIRMMACTFLLKDGTSVQLIYIRPAL